MKRPSSQQSLALVALATLFGGALTGASCNNSGGGGGNGGSASGGGSGDGGSTGEGGGTADGGNSGTGNSGTGGDGGSSDGGTTGKGGSGGSKGGSGGTPPSGGSGGTASGGSGTGGAGNVSAACTPRPTNGGGINGPSAVWSGPAGTGMPYTEVTVSGARVLVPGSYAAAADGKVGITFISGAMADNKLQSASAALILAGMMPPMVYVVDGIDWGGASNTGGSNITSRAETLTRLLAAVRVMYPKISNDAKMHAVAGQSTAGAVAFDLAWSRPTVFGKVLGASASMVGFMQWLYPYEQKIDATKKDQIRVAFDVGECDLVWEAGLIPAVCSNVCSSGNCICVGCGDGNWVAVNRSATQRLLDLGYKANLLIRARGVHNVWTGAIADDLAFLWRDTVCP